MDFYFLFSIVFIIATCLGGFLNSWKKIKELASKTHKTKNKALNFLGYEKSEYPGTNEEYLEINREKWATYYQCLQDQNDHLGKYLTVSPEAILGFEGNYIKMECKICMSPLKRKSPESTKWEWVPQDKKYFEPVEITENVVVSPEDKTLHLYNLQLGNTGQYICRLGDTLTAPYFLTVISMLENEMLEVHSPEGTIGPYPQPPETLQAQNLVIDTEWSEWSKCSKCNEVGKRHKLGYCAINLKKFEEPELTDANNGTAEGSEDDKEALLPDLQLFVIFKFGIPCRSHILPKYFQDLPEVKKRKNEMMTGYCKERCPSNSIFEVRDTHGKVLERANNSEGIYSMLQPLPPLEPPVQRKLQYAVKSQHITVQCPGSLNSDTPIHWQIGEKNLIPELISDESKGRIYISISDRIHIKNSRISDSNIYSCWQKSELTGIVRLVVEKKLELNFLQHVMLLGVVVILGVFLWVFARAFAGRKYARI